MVNPFELLDDRLQRIEEALDRLTTITSTAGTICHSRQTHTSNAPDGSRIPWSIDGYHRQPCTLQAAKIMQGWPRYTLPLGSTGRVY